MILLISGLNLGAIILLVGGIIVLCHPVSGNRCTFSSLLFLILAYSSLIFSAMINIARVNMLPVYFSSFGPVASMAGVFFFLFFVASFQLNAQLNSLQSRLNHYEKRDSGKFPASADVAAVAGDAETSLPAPGIQNTLLKPVGPESAQLPATPAVKSAGAASLPNPSGVVKLQDSFKKNSGKLPIGFFDLREAIKEALAGARLSFSAKIQIAIDLPQEILPVKGDLNQVELAIANICVNSGEAMPQGGNLSVRAETREMVPEDATNSQARLHAVVTVSDTGVGIPFELQNRIFEPFFTTKQSGGGAGMGLVTTMKLIKKYNGSVVFKSEPGAGTTFEIALPLAV